MTSSVVSNDSDLSFLSALEEDGVAAEHFTFVIHPAVQGSLSIGLVESSSDDIHHNAHSPHHHHNHSHQYSEQASCEGSSKGGSSSLWHATTGSITTVDEHSEHHSIVSQVRRFRALIRSEEKELGKFANLDHGGVILSEDDHLEEELRRLARAEALLQNELAGLHCSIDPIEHDTSSVKEQEQHSKDRADEINVSDWVDRGRWTAVDVSDGFGSSITNSPRQPGLEPTSPGSSAASPYHSFDLKGASTSSVASPYSFDLKGSSVLSSSTSPPFSPSRAAWVGTREQLNKSSNSKVRAMVAALDRTSSKDDSDLVVIRKKITPRGHVRNHSNPTVYTVSPIRRPQTPSSHKSSTMVFTWPPTPDKNTTPAKGSAKGPAKGPVSQPTPSITPHGMGTPMIFTWPPTPERTIPAKGPSSQPTTKKAPYDGGGTHTSSSSTPITSGQLARLGKGSPALVNQNKVIPHTTAKPQKNYQPLQHPPIVESSVWTGKAFPDPPSSSPAAAAAAASSRGSAGDHHGHHHKPLRSSLSNSNKTQRSGTVFKSNPSTGAVASSLWTPQTRSIRNTTPTTAATTGSQHPQSFAFAFNDMDGLSGLAPPSVATPVMGNTTTRKKPLQHQKGLTVQASKHSAPEEYGTIELAAVSQPASPSSIRTSKTGSPYQDEVLAPRVLDFGARRPSQRAVDDHRTPGKQQEEEEVVVAAEPVESFPSRPTVASPPPPALPPPRRRSRQRPSTRETPFPKEQHPPEETFIDEESNQHKKLFQQEEVSYNELFPNQDIDINESFQTQETNPSEVFQNEGRDPNESFKHPEPKRNQAFPSDRKDHNPGFRNEGTDQNEPIRSGGTGQSEEMLRANSTGQAVETLQKVPFSECVDYKPGTVHERSSQVPIVDTRSVFAPREMNIAVPDANFELSHDDALILEKGVISNIVEEGLEHEVAELRTRNQDAAPFTGKGEQVEVSVPEMTPVTNGTENKEVDSVTSGNDLGFRYGALGNEMADFEPFCCGQPTFSIAPADLLPLTEERNRTCLANLLAKVASPIEKDDMKHTATKNAKHMDLEAPSRKNGTEIPMKLMSGIADIVDEIRHDEWTRRKILPDTDEEDDHDPVVKAADKKAHIAANLITSVLLKSHPDEGIDASQVELRREVFGSNAVAAKKLLTFWQLCWKASQDFVLMMLIVLGVVGIAAEVIKEIDEGGRCTDCWIEGAAILVSVCIVVLVTGSINFAKQRSFSTLNETLSKTNTKVVIRDGKVHRVTDDDIVVGDILLVNSLNLATIPADCILLGPYSHLKMDESALTGESRLRIKKPGDIVLSGTTAVEGTGKMVVIAVGSHSLSGKIRACVYDSTDVDSNDIGMEGETSPLFVKIEKIAKQIGFLGTIAAGLGLAGLCALGFGLDHEPVDQILDYVVTAITILAVAVPEGLPLAVTLSLAFCSNKMMREQNLVKRLDVCDTMGCATTICTDKTGTLTASKMVVRAAFVRDRNMVVEDPATTLGAYMKQLGASPNMINLLCEAISINTMNETVLHLSKDQDEVIGSNGNPTEIALLHLVRDFGQDYSQIRNNIRGRAVQGTFREFFADGKSIAFSSGRKMMSWIVPLPNGGYRLYCKGAPEILLSRCVSFTYSDGTSMKFDRATKKTYSEAAKGYARRGMRVLAVAYRDLPDKCDLEATTSRIKNSDGSPANIVETKMTMISLLGIEDPLRPEIPDAIGKCNSAGIDVRLVTGDNPNTAVSVAYQAGILRDFHFADGSTERVVDNLRDNVLMEGKDFRRKVYTINKETGERKFDQTVFDEIWPHLRILARCSPDDKLALAHGLNQSNLFADTEACRRLRDDFNIEIFPDRQVVAMTGDGTNDAPALKRADIGFAMGIAGTQTAKDAADIILLDDNFASIVSAAKWGRNIYASIQKFLQFQLTVNISAVCTSLVGTFVFRTSPLAAIQLLWVNLLMDSLASLALASEPPVEELLLKPPVNRSDSMISKRMWANMLGQASYQVAVMMVLLFLGPDLLGVEPGHEVEDRGENSEHYTLMFNSFVWMQLFNEINSRMLEGESNVFKGILKNPMFCWILVITAGLQVVIVEKGSIAFSVADGGLDLEFWGLSVLLGFGSLPMQQLINVLYRFCGTHQSHGSVRNRQLSTQAETEGSFIEV